MHAEYLKLNVNALDYSSHAETFEKVLVKDFEFDINAIEIPLDLVYRVLGMSYRGISKFMCHLDFMTQRI